MKNAFVVDWMAVVSGVAAGLVVVAVTHLIDQSLGGSEIGFTGGALVAASFVASSRTLARRPRNLS
jgi:hypothetical protein